jgi:hypothetical protein
MKVSQVRGNLLCFGLGVLICALVGLVVILARDLRRTRGRLQAVDALGKAVTCP